MVLNVRRSSAPDRVPPSRAAVLATCLALALLWIGVPAPAHAMTRGTHPHHPLAAHSEPVLPRSSRGSRRSPAASSSAHPAPRASRRRPLPAGRAPARQTRTRHAKRAPQSYDDDPILMHRARDLRHAKPGRGMATNRSVLSPRELTADRRAEAAWDRQHGVRSANRREDLRQPRSRRPNARNAVARRERPREIQTGERAIAEAPHTLTTADFLRAAGPPSASSRASGAALPDEANDGGAADDVSGPTDAATSSAAGASPSRSGAHTPPSVRVDGFGSEGALLSATAAPATSRRGRRKQPSPTPEAAAADPTVAALARLSPRELGEEAVQPLVLPTIYNRDGRLMTPAALKGSHEILVHQNFMADQAGLERIRDDDELQRMRAAGKLVDIVPSASLRVNPELGADRRCARPWAVRFANDLAANFFARFHEPLQLNSAVRTVAYQRRLQRVNGNAAALTGDTASPHLTGQALDFGKRGMSAAEIAWMRAYLLPLAQAGEIDVEEEFQQACFHVSVYQSYAPMRRRGVADAYSEARADLHTRHVEPSAPLDRSASAQTLP